MSNNRVFRVLLAGLIGCGGSAAPMPGRPASAASTSAVHVDAEVVDGPPVLVPQVSGYVSEVHPSPDGKLVATKRWNGIYIVDIGSHITRGFASIGCAWSIVFSSDSKKLFASACKQKVVHVWNLADDTVRDIEISFAHAHLLPRASATRVLASSLNGDAGLDVVDAAQGAATHVQLDSANQLLDGEIAADGAAIYAGRKSLVVIPPGGASRSFDYGFNPGTAAIDRAGRFTVVMNADPRAEDVVIDTSSLKISARRTACGATTVAITPDGRHIVSACKDYPGDGLVKRLVITNPAFGPIYGASFPDEIESLRLFGPNVLVRAQRPIASLIRFPKGSTPKLSDPTPWFGDLREISENGDVFVSGGATAGWSVVDGSDGRPLYVLPASLEDTGFRKTGHGFLDGDDGRVFDVARRAPIDARFTDDGTATYVCSRNGPLGQNECRFTPLAKGKPSWAIRPGGGNPDFSPGGHYAFFDGVLEDGPYCEEVSFEGPNGKCGTTDCMGGHWDLSPREDYIATMADCSARRRRKPTGGVCDVVELTPLAGGAPIDIEGKKGHFKAHLSFSRDGRELVVADTVYDVRARKELWSTPPDEQDATFIRPWSAVITRVDASSNHASLRFRDPLNGELIATAPYWRVEAMSPRGSFAVLRANDDTFGLLDTKSLVIRPFDVSSSHLYPTDDGAFVWFSEDDVRFAYRMSDGRILGYVACPECDGGHVVMTDEGVMGAPRDASSYAVRKGPNVLKSPIELVTEFPSERVRPTLEADFFAGKDVSLAK